MTRLKLMMLNNNKSTLLGYFPFTGTFSSKHRLPGILNKCKFFTINFVQNQPRIDLSFTSLLPQRFLQSFSAFHHPFISYFSH
jgi:hypothetical protein